MAGMFMVHQTGTLGSILCNKCGIQMSPNAANICAKCLSSEIDITEGLQKHVIIIHCSECDSYLQPPTTWLNPQLESKEFLTCCLNRLKNLNEVRLIHAEFIQTESHYPNRTINVKLRVQKEVLNGVILEQAYIVQYIIQDRKCESCSRVLTDPDQWVAAVQLIQQVNHRRTFFYLEQLILKHKAALKAVRIREVNRGMDFFFTNRNHAVKFVEFVQKVVPTKTHNNNNNHNHKKHNFCVEICPICREDLIWLPRKLANGLGNFGPFVICVKVSNFICLVDPLTLGYRFLDPEQYWRVPFTSLLSSKQLTEYIILDVDPISSEVNVGGSKYVLADVQVARVSDFGNNDTIFFVRTHLGHVLNSGDFALGYDLQSANINDTEVDMYKNLVIPEVILIKKSYEEKRVKKRGKRRSWKLKSLKMEVDYGSEKRGVSDEEKRNLEYELFLRELEENPEMCFNISLYRDKEYRPSENGNDDVPFVPLEELLADLVISDESVVDGGMEE